MAVTIKNIGEAAIELHYWFVDDSHTMDAFIENRCEIEFLKLVDAIAKGLGTDILIETEALGEGGLRKWFRISKTAKNRRPLISGTVIVAIATTLIVNPLGAGLGKTAEKLVEEIFKSKEEKQLEIEGKRLDNDKKKAEIENIAADTKLKQEQLHKAPTIAKRRSNFYEGLAKYPKLQKISFSVKDENRQTTLEYTVNKGDFQRFVLTTDEIKPLEIENAVIEIISPVLKSGKFKWKGIYDGEVLSFNMLAEGFKQLVQSGTVEFKNGTTIRCDLEIKRKLNNEGEEENTEYNIVSVSEYFDDANAGKIVQSKKTKKKKGGSNKQLGLF
jgi:hypothetical protein